MTPEPDLNERRKAAFGSTSDENLRKLSFQGDVARIQTQNLETARDEEMVSDDEVLGAYKSEAETIETSLAAGAELRRREERRNSALRNDRKPKR